MSNQPQSNSAPATPAQALLAFLKAMGLAALAASVLCAGAPAARAQATDSDRNRVSLPAGSVIPVTLNSPLSSSKSTKGDPFTASVDAGPEAYGDTLRGATVLGVVRESTPQKGSEPGTLDLSFTSLRLADGRMCALTGSLASLDPSRVSAGENGILQARDLSEHGRLIYAGIGPASGALVDMNGDSYTIEDRGTGSGDYAAGAVVKNPADVHDVFLRPGARLGVLLANRIVFFKRPHEAALKAIFHKIMPPKGVKYYQYNGQTWAMNLASGQRYPVSGDTGAGGN
jgi:hypothetical protein